MSYILFATSGSGGVQNPMTSNLDAANNDITAIGTSDATVVVVGDSLEMTNPAGTVGFYGVPPTPQAPPIADIPSGDPEAIAINEILNALRALGVVAV